MEDLGIWIRNSVIQGPGSPVCSKPDQLASTEHIAVGVFLVSAGVSFKMVVDWYCGASIFNFTYL